MRRFYNARRPNVSVIKELAFGDAVKECSSTLKALFEQVGPGTSGYKVVIVYDEGGGSYVVRDQWGGRLFSYKVHVEAGVLPGD
jgi:hypothetical protein